MSIVISGGAIFSSVFTFKVYMMTMLSIFYKVEENSEVKEHKISDLDSKFNGDEQLVTLNKNYQDKMPGEEEKMGHVVNRSYSRSKYKNNMSLDDSVIRRVLINPIDAKKLVSEKVQNKLMTRDWF
jgi:hypothetical protein